VPVEQFECDVPEPDEDLCAEFLLAKREEEQIQIRITVIETKKAEELTESGEERLGTDSMIDNLGIYILFSIAFVLLLICLTLLAIFAKRNKQVQGLYLQLKDKIFWNPIIRGVIQSTLKMQVAAGAVIALYFRDRT